MNIRNEIVGMMNEFLKTHGHNPTKIHFPLKKENELILLPGIDLVKGPRYTFKNGICGLKIVWDAKQFKVE